LARSSSAGRAGAHWAFLSDIHISANSADRNRGFSPAANLGKAVSQVVQADPQGAAITGDLARLMGLKEDYQTAKALLDPLPARMALALTLGNHDDRKNFFPVFAPAGEGPVKDRQVSVVEARPMRFILLDSLLATNVTPGLVGRDERNWLEQYLKTSDATPTAIFFHHPPDDADNNLLDSDRLLRIVMPARKVKAVVFGHSHAYRFDTMNGLHLINLPAVGYNFADSEPVGWVEARMAAEGADFTLHAVGGNMAQDGQTKSLGWR
jgi:3',5'-cyclic AMP phosphodiesterase CpdA